MPFQLDLPDPKLNWKLVGVLLILVALVVAMICWQIWRTKPPKPEVYKPAVQQLDGSVILERKPDATVKPKAAVPPKATVERVVSVTVKPTKKPAVPDKATDTWQQYFDKNKGESPAAESSVTVDLSLVREKDGSRRVIASSDDGEIIGGVDIPVEAALPMYEPRRWGVGISYDPFKNALGAIVQRSIDELLPVTIGAEIHQTREGSLSSPGFRIHALYNF